MNLLISKLPFIQYLLKKTAKFTWHFFIDEYLEFVYMPNGYGPAMQIFTKISKIQFSILREKGFLSVVYVDDSICKVVIMRIASLMFWTQQKFLDLLDSQSTLTNSNSFQWNLGLILNSVKTTITLTLEKKEKELNLCQEMLREDIATIRFILKLIENLVAAFSAVILVHL